MKCSKIKILFPEYIGHTLDDSDHSMVSRHLTDCEDCRQEYQLMENTFRVIGRESSWTPPDNYWRGVLPRIHRRREIRSQHRTPDWLVRFAAPFAGALLLIVLSVRIFTLGPTIDAQSSPGELSELPQQELQEFLHHQSIVGLAEQSDTTTEASSPDADIIMLKALAQEDGKYLMVIDTDDEALFASITDQEAENIVTILENK